MNSSKKYGAAGHYFHSCAKKETTDHYSQSRYANKNPQATIRTAALPHSRAANKNPRIINLYRRAANSRVLELNMAATRRR